MPLVSTGQITIVDQNDGTSSTILNLFQAGADQTTVPTKPAQNVVTYNIKTKALTGAGSWQIGMPELGNTPVYATTYTFITTTPDVAVTANGTWTDPVVVARKGQDATNLVVELTNDYHAIPTDSNGNNASYTAAETTAKVYLNGTEQTINGTDYIAYVSALSNVTYRDANDENTRNNVGNGTSDSQGLISSFPLKIMSLSADAGSIDISVKRVSTGTVLTKTFSLAKNKGGVKGTDATIYYITPSVNVIAKASPDAATDGVHTPNSVDFTIYKVVGNTTAQKVTDGSVFYTLWNNTTSGGEPSTATALGSTGIVSQSIADNSDYTFVKLRLYTTSSKTLMLDEETIPVVFKGVKGTDGTPGINANGLTFINAVNCTGSIDTVTRTDGVAVGWTAGARTAESYASGAFASVVCDTNQTVWDTMFGLNTEDSTQNYDDLDYAINLASGTIRIYEKGTEQGTGFGSYVAGDVLTIAYDGNKVIYLKNNNIIYQKSANIVKPIFFDCSLYSANSKLTKIKFGALSSVTNQDLVNTKTWQVGTVGLQGTRTAVLNLYLWSQSMPRQLPSGTSIYTWSTGDFTLPEITNNWTLVPGTPLTSHYLWVVRLVYSDSNSSATTNISWKNVIPRSLGQRGSLGLTGNRVGWLEVYRWSTTKPTTYPSGSSTYTWENGSFTDPILNSWIKIPGATGTLAAPVTGSTLWAIGVPITDSLGTTTSSITWSSTTPYVIDTGGNIYPENFIPRPIANNGSNKIALSTIPNGTTGLVWQAVGGTDAGPSGYNTGGWDSCGEIPIDRTKMYRFSCYFRQTSGSTTGFVYLLPKINTISPLTAGSSGDGTIPTGVADNIWFVAIQKTAANIVTNEWYFMTGYIYPYGYSGDTILGGVYRVSTGAKIQNATASYKWTSESTYSTTTLRVATIEPAGSAVNSNIEFWGPRIDQMDGTEATLDILDVAKINNTVNNNTTSGARVTIDSTNGGRIIIRDAAGDIRIVLGYLL